MVSLVVVQTAFSIPTLLFLGYFHTQWRGPDAGWMFLYAVCIAGLVIALPVSQWLADKTSCVYKRRWVKGFLGFVTLLEVGLLVWNIAVLVQFGQALGNVENICVNGRVESTVSCSTAKIDYWIGISCCSIVIIVILLNLFHIVMLLYYDIVVFVEDLESDVCNDIWDERELFLPHKRRMSYFERKYSSGKDSEGSNSYM